MTQDEFADRVLVLSRHYLGDPVLVAGILTQFNHYKAKEEISPDLVKLCQHFYQQGKIDGYGHTGKLEVKYENLFDATKRLFDKLVEVHMNPSYGSIWEAAYAKGVLYTGPGYLDEFYAVEELLEHHTDDQVQASLDKICGNVQTGLPDDPDADPGYLKQI